LEDNVGVKSCAIAQYKCGTDDPETAISRRSGTSDVRGA